MTAFGQAENGDSGPLFELLAEALPAFSLEEDDGRRSSDSSRRSASLSSSPNTATTRALPGPRHADPWLRGIGPLRRAVSGLGGETVAELMRTAFERRTRPDGVSLTDDYRLLIARA
jgi:hypothetical protein